jgi:hypothetical protein
VIPSRTVDRERPAEIVAGLLASASIFISCLGLAYRPVRLIPVAVILALIAAAVGGRAARLAAIAVGVGALCFALGMAIAVITEHPLF